MPLSCRGRFSTRTTVARSQFKSRRLPARRTARAALITDEWRAAVDDYRKQNAATRFIRPGFDLGTPYSLVAWADVRQMLKDERYLAPNAP